MFTWLQSCEIKCWVSRTQRAIDQTLTQLLPSPFTSLDLKFYHFTHYPVAPWANNEKHQPFQCFSVISHLQISYCGCGFSFTVLLKALYKYLHHCYKSNNEGSERANAPSNNWWHRHTVFPKWSWICMLVAVANHWAVLQFWGERLVVNYQ